MRSFFNNSSCLTDHDPPLQESLDVAALPTQADLCWCCTVTAVGRGGITHGARHGDAASETFTAYLGRQRCLLSSSPGPSWSLPPEFLSRAAAAAAPVVAPAAGCSPVGTDRSPPSGPQLQPRPGRRWSPAVGSPSSSRLFAVPMKHSKNVAPGWDRQARDLGESRWGREWGRRTPQRRRVRLRQTTQRKTGQHRKLGDAYFKLKVDLVPKLKKSTPWNHVVGLVMVKVNADCFIVKEVTGIGLSTLTCASCASGQSTKVNIHRSLRFSTWWDCSTAHGL